MIKYLLFILFFTQSVLFSKNYCMYIDQYNYTLSNKSKIYTILNDIAYPSFKIAKSKIKIYSGKFKTYDDAEKLLHLTKTRYKNARVASCDDAQRYRAGSLFETRTKEVVKKSYERSSQEISNEYYCLQVFDASLQESAKERNKINYILNRLPDTKTEVHNNHFFIYSGNFETRESARTIAKILRREFKDTKVSICNTTTPIKGTKKVQKQKPAPSIYHTNETFNIGMLDDKGYIDADIASSRSANKSHLKKSDIRHALDSQRDEYFNGLYLKTNTAYDVQNNDSAYDVKLEFDIFDQGYYQNKKKNERNRITNQINFYKTVKNIEVLKKEQELLKIKKYENSINVSTLLLRLRITEENLNRAKVQSQRGLLTEYDYDEYKLSLQKVKDELLLFKNMTLLKIPKDLFQLLNHIEYVRLIDEDSLLKALREDSIDLKLAKTLQDSKPLEDSWSDKLRVNLYAGVRKMYLSQNQTLIGVEAKIPLTNYSRTQELQNVQTTVLAEQVRLQHSKSKEMLRDAIATFKYKQQKLKTYAYELSRIKKHLTDLNIINNSAYASYAHLNLNDEQKSIDNYLQKYTLIQQERINSYKELINIMYLIHTDKINDVLKYSISQ